MHFNVKDASLESGSSLVLWGCQAASHEVFTFKDDKRLHIKDKQDPCVNAEGGLAAGNRLIAWPCAHEVSENEMWEHDISRKVIRSRVNPRLGFNIKGAAVSAGTEI